MDDAPQVPPSFWVIAWVSLLWNAFGCFDYLMTKLDPVDYMRSGGMGAEAIAYMERLPGWLTVFWALGVWGSLAGSVLLLRRSRLAVAAFAVSLVGLAVSQFYQWFTGPMPAEMTTAPMAGINAMIWAVLLFLIWYARWARRQGWLR